MSKPERIKRGQKTYRLDGEFYVSEDEQAIIYKGKRYQLVGRYYWNLHRDVWRDHFGEIPEDHQIHHRDGNPKNNNIENLLCIHRKVHSAYTVRNNKWIGSEENRQQLSQIRGKALLWHATEEGKRWHINQGKEFWKNKKPVSKKCEECGNEYLYRWHTSKYCHNKCKKRARRRSGLDNVNRSCEICQKYFIINKYQKTRTCSKDCVAELNKRKKLLLETISGNG
jgi:hypothetical protein